MNSLNTARSLHSLALILFAKLQSAPSRSRRDGSFLYVKKEIIPSAQSGTNCSSRQIGEDAISAESSWEMRHNGFSLFVSVARTSTLRPPATSEVVNPPYKAVKAVLFSISELER